jgi:hypothetical protein
VVWGDVVEGSAREILGDAEACNEERLDDSDNPAEALRRILSSGPLTGKEAKNLMVGNGYTQKQIRNARENLSVTTARAGFGADTVVTWSLPQATGDYAAFPHGEKKPAMYTSVEAELSADEVAI